MAEAPKHQPTVEPQAQPAPQPQQQVPYEQQPVQQQYFAQPNAAPVQYVIAQKSLKGIGGWLLFFTVIAGLAALGYASSFIGTIANFSVDKIADVIFFPVLLAAAIASVVLIALEKTLAKYVYMGFFGVAYLYSIINQIVRSAKIEELSITILVGGLWVLFAILYFMVSKRVKETLVK